MRQPATSPSSSQAWARCPGRSILRSSRCTRVLLGFPWQRPQIGAAIFSFRIRSSTLRVPPGPRGHSGSTLRSVHSAGSGCRHSSRTDASKFSLNSLLLECLSSCSLCYRYVNLPETRGLALEEIQQLFVRASDHQVLAGEDEDDAAEMVGENQEEQRRDARGEGEGEKLIKGSAI